jgi:hypothetical protein
MMVRGLHCVGVDLCACWLLLSCCFDHTCVFRHVFRAWPLSLIAWPDPCPPARLPAGDCLPLMVVVWLSSLNGLPLVDARRRAPGKISEYDPALAPPPGGQFNSPYSGKPQANMVYDSRQGGEGTLSQTHTC